MRHLTPGMRFAAMLGVAVIYFMLGRFGLGLAFVHPSASAVWPPTGFALAVLLLGGYRLWPGVFAGALLVNITTGSGIAPGIAIGTGNALEALAGAWLVARIARLPDPFLRSRDVFAFTAAAAAAALVSAGIGVTSLALAGSVAWEKYVYVGATWWLADATAAMLVTPVIVQWVLRPGIDWSAGRWLEMLLLTAAVVATALLVFGYVQPGSGRQPLSFLCLPPLMWAAFRFGPRETATLALAVAAVAIAGTLRGLGPFALTTPNDSLLLLQSFLAVFAVFAIATAAAVAERRFAFDERLDRLHFEQAERQRADELNRAKDEFLATVSHELRTPLNAMLGWVVLARTASTDPAMVSRALEVIERNTRLQIRLIEDLLDISHMIAGRFHYEPRPLDLGAAVRAACDAMSMSARERNITLTPHLPDTPTPVLGDAARLQQVVSNLLANAIKFTPEGGRVDVTLGQHDQEAVVRVADSGPGIDPEFLPHLFAPFRQAGVGARRRYGGLGIGLSIVRHLVEIHGGRVSGTNREAGGAEFAITLPRASGATLAEDGAVTPASGEQILEGVRVLVVEDEPDARTLAATLLEAAGAIVTVAATVPEALRAFETQGTDVLVSDIGLDDEDGYDLIRRLRALPERQGGRVPAIALTAHAMQHERQRAIGAGFQEHIAKPYEPISLIEAVARLAGNGK